MNELPPLNERDIQHYSWQNVFREYTWFSSPDMRRFVVVRVQRDIDTGDYEQITLLEENKELPVQRPYREIVDLFKKGLLIRTSKQE